MIKIALLVLLKSCFCDVVQVNVNRFPLRVYWNVPSFQCNPFKMNFTEILDRYKIIHNEEAKFRGSKINILYDPGNFPAILKDGVNIVLRNGGVPQEGNLSEHLNIFAEIVDQLIPDVNTSGLVVIDFESWRPIYRQNWGTLSSYKTLSEDLERQRHPTWSDAWIKAEAQKRFEEWGNLFVINTLKVAKTLRPNAKWGYYHYPYCYSSGLEKQCPKQVVAENDRLHWLFETSDNLYPSVYLQEAHEQEQRVRFIESSIEEAIRLKHRSNNKKVYVYFWYKFQDTANFFNKQDLFTILTVLASFNIDGLILWGASADVNSKKHCSQVYNYINEVLGPVILHV